VIDDITVAASVSGIDQVPFGMLPLKTVAGRPDTYGVSCGRGLFVTFCPATRVVTVRISVPRWLHGHPVNFPLRPIAGVEALRLDRLAQEVAGALGLRLSSIGDEARRRLPLDRWAVIRASFAADLLVRDPVRSVEGAIGIDRRHGGRRQLFGRPLSTIQWSSRSLRSKLYSKELEIRSHRRSDPAEANVLRQLAEQATRVLRFEVSFLQVRALRLLFKKPALLPTLSLMCDPFVSAFVLEREAIRLRLDEDPHAIENESFGARVRRIVAVLDQAQRDLASGGQTLGRRRSLSDQRKCDLILSHILGSGLVTPAAVAAFWGVSESAVRELFSELRELQIPPDASPAATLGVTCRDIWDALVPHLPTDEARERNLEHRRGRGDNFVAAPWAVQPLDDNDHSCETDEETGDAEDGLSIEDAIDTAIQDATESPDIGLDDDLPFAVEPA